jgi:alpha-galactosidase
MRIEMMQAMTNSSFTRQWLDTAIAAPSQPPPRVTLRSQGWGQLEYGTSIAGAKPCLAGQRFDHGLGTHADSEIVVTPGTGAARFQASVGIDDNPDTRGYCEAKLVFTVSADGTELWCSRELGVEDEPDQVDVAVPADARELVLAVTSVSGGVGRTHADWAEAQLVSTDGTTWVLGQAPLPTAPPVDFLCDGKPLAELLPGWTRSAGEAVERDGLTVHPVTWRDPASGLELRLEAKTSADFPVVEWVPYLKNTGSEESPLIENIQSLSGHWCGGNSISLHRSRGSGSCLEDFQYQSAPLPLGATESMKSGDGYWKGGGGRSSHEWLPFFNLQDGDGGVIVAIGWTGQWVAEFAHGENGLVEMRAGMEKTRLRLHPGEEIRLPGIFLLFWEGDRLDGHNLLRRYMRAHHSPSVEGEPVQGPISAPHWGSRPTTHHLDRIATYAAEGLDFEYYWIDAQWFGQPDETSDWQKQAGDWQINTAHHPEGLRPISDAANRAGMKFLLWVEPERAVCGTPITLEHPEWFLGEHTPGANLLVDFSQPEARRWVIETVAGIIEENGVACYRQDFNMDPLPYWRAADEPDRQGMHEIRHIEGLYAFWDELLERFPNLLIDNCASGGRRLDYEMASRSIPLWRSDFQCEAESHDPIGSQVQGMGLAHWLPLSGTGTNTHPGDTYSVRSALAAGITFQVTELFKGDIGSDYPFDWLRRMLAEHRRFRPLCHGDYYPLANTTPSTDHWAAYQFHRPDLGQGCVVAFRRPGCRYSSADLPLRGLDPAAEYELEDADTGRRWRQTGADLMDQGLAITIDEQRGSSLIFYEAIEQNAEEER